MQIHYHIVRHEDGWTYKLGDVFAETFASHDEALAAARQAAAEQQVGDTSVPIRWQDADGSWHEEISAGDDRPKVDVIDAP